MIINRYTALEDICILWNNLSGIQACLVLQGRTRLFLQGRLPNKNVSCLISPFFFLSVFPWFLHFFLKFALCFLILYLWVSRLNKVNGYFCTTHPPTHTPTNTPPVHATTLCNNPISSKHEPSPTHTSHTTHTPDHADVMLVSIECLTTSSFQYHISTKSTLPLL